MHCLKHGLDAAVYQACSPSCAAEPCLFSLICCCSATLAARLCLYASASNVLAVPICRRRRSGKANSQLSTSAGSCLEPVQSHADAAAARLFSEGFTSRSGQQQAATCIKRRCMACSRTSISAFRGCVHAMRPPCLAVACCGAAGGTPWPQTPKRLPGCAESRGWLRMRTPHATAAHSRAAQQQQHRGGN